MTSLRLCHKCFTVLSNTRTKQYQLIKICGKVLQNNPRSCQNYIASHALRFNSTSTADPTNTHTTIDQDEHHKFTKLASHWWDEKGEFYALHSMNRLRIPLIRDAFVDASDKGSKIFPLKDKLILDVGSGGGIIAEPLARLGATVTGIDMVEENIRIAQTHISQDPEISGRVNYIHGAVEDLTEEGKFDAVVASEVVEHVSDVEMFISSCCKLIKPGGYFFLTTLNKTYASYLLAVLGAEHLLRIVPPGTHDWNKFISPEELQLSLEQNGMTVRLLHGMCYNPVINRWSWISNTDINYAMYAVKSSQSIHSHDTIEQTDY
ncbi:ubiquinone biosynthesis O-methyltransferase, mitochondrial-like [Mytilus trossulus]|uniref:ubiquinone biosynthesis O-methyltransferase, mitochondrial-like n=1 Tax=Mytilus trossulus TaxID=6551 RepID=UPI003005CDB6